MISVSIGQDAFSSAILSALIEIPSYVFVMLFVDNFGRKPILVFTLFLTGISCIPAGYVTGNFQTALSLAGKNKSIRYSVLVTFAACHMCGRVDFFFILVYQMETESCILLDV